MPIANPTPFERKQSALDELLAVKAEQDGQPSLARHYRNLAYLRCNPNPLPYKRVREATDALAEMRDIYVAFVNSRSES